MGWIALRRCFSPHWLKDCSLGAGLEVECHARCQHNLLFHYGKGSWESSKAGCQDDKQNPHHCPPFWSPLKGSLEHVFSKITPAPPCVTARPMLSTCAEGMLAFLFLHDLLCGRSLDSAGPRAGKGWDRSQRPLPCSNLSVSWSTCCCLISWVYAQVVRLNSPTRSEIRALDSCFTWL